MSKIFYNGINIFTSQPTPLVSRTIEPIFRKDGRQLAMVEKISLVGQITGCDFSTISGFQSVISSGFNRDFGDLRFEDYNFTGTASGCKVLSVDFQQGTMVGIQNYTINLQSYNESFYETIGIIEKKNSWSISQEENGNTNITHEIFAKGANTGPQYNNAFDKAKSFVLSLTGFNPPSLFPFFISGFSGSLDSRSENINRLEGTYGISESYVGSSGNKISQETTINLTSGNDGIIQVDVNGTFRGGKNENFDIVRTAYSGFDAFAYVTGMYFDYRKVTGLFSLPLSSGYTENIRDGSIDFNISFNDYPTVRFKHVPSIQITSGQDGIITASLNGEVQGLGRQRPLRYDNAYNFFTGLNIFNLANEEYNIYVGTGYGYSLNTFPLSSGIGIDRFGGKITYNVTFNDKPLGLNCSGIKNFDYSVRKEYAMRALRFGMVPYSESGGCVQDLNYASRATISVNGNVLSNPSVLRAKTAAQQFVNYKFRLQYMQGRDNMILDGGSISENIDSNSATFDYNISFDEAAPINADVSYTFITGLTI